MKPKSFYQKQRTASMTQSAETPKPTEVQTIDPVVAPADTVEQEQTQNDPQQVVEQSADVVTGSEAPAQEVAASEQKSEVTADPAPAPDAPAPVDGVKDESMNEDSVVEETAAAETVADPEPEETPQVEEDISEEAAYLAKIRVSGTEGQKKILAAIELYCERFRPRAPVNGSEGVKWQYEFLLHALKLINSEYDVFKSGWNVLLVFFKENHGRSSVSNTSPISDGPASRFGPYWERGEETWAAYKNIFELLRATRDPATRKMNVKNIVMERVGPGLITEDGLRNLRRFYQ